MSLGTNFLGVKLDKTKIRSYKYALLVCNSSSFNRGQLFEDGSNLYLMGVTDDFDYNRDPDQVKDFGLGEAVFSRKAGMSATVYANVNEKALQELEDSKVTLFVVDSHKLIGLNGFSFSAADFSSINGICNAEYIFDNTFLSIKRESKGDSVEQYELAVNINNQANLYTKVYQDEPVGTFTVFWDWTSSSSLIDSVNSVTLSKKVGTEAHSSDHYVLDGTSGEGLLVNDFASNSVLNPANSKLFCISIDVSRDISDTGNGLFLTEFGDGDSSRVALIWDSTTGVEISMETPDGEDTSIATHLLTQTNRNQFLAYINKEKNIYKIIDSSDYTKDTDPTIAVNPTETIGTFTGSDRDFHIALNEQASFGSNIDVYKYGISS